MELYKELGFESKDELKNTFFDSLLKSNYTYDFFADWNKIFNNVNEFNDEINILNTLCHVPKEDLDEKFVAILENNPNVVNFIPNLLAIREKQLEILDIEQGNFKEISFLKNSDVNDVFIFSKKSGLLDLFSEIYDLKSYILGLELGLDTHTRKNRSGNTFKEFIRNFLEMKLSNKFGFTLYENVKISSSLNNKFDFVISKYDDPVAVIQCNFYNFPGSKAKQLVNYNINIQNELKERGIQFIWLIDGKGWLKMKNIVDMAFNNIDLVLNYDLLNHNFDQLLNI